MLFSPENIYGFFWQELRDFSNPWSLQSNWSNLDILNLGFSSYEGFIISNYLILEGVIQRPNLKICGIY